MFGNVSIFLLSIIRGMSAKDRGFVGAAAAEEDNVTGRDRAEGAHLSMSSVTDHLTIIP